MLQIDQLKRMAANAVDLTVEAREWSEQARDYYDSHQLTAAEQATLNKRKQPIVISNRIQRKIDAMIGIEQKGRVDPRAYPRNPQDEDQADVVTKALTFVDDNTRFDIKKSQSFENLLIEGYGGVEVIVEERRGKFEICVNRLRWEELFFDPHSREKDFSDASYLGVMKWMTADKADELYGSTYDGDLMEDLQASMSESAGDSTFEDKPAQNTSVQWVDKRQRRVRVAQMYYRREGKWHLAIFSGNTEITNQVSPYHDEDGEPTCPIHLMTAYIDRENRRYGLVRPMIWTQDEINKRRSKLLHQLNSRTTVGVKGAFDSVAEMKRQRDAPDGHVEINIEAFEDAARVGVKPFETLSNADQVAGQFNLLTESKNEIDLVGPNPSLVGQTQGGASGRAIMAQQQAGLAELQPIYDSLRDWTLRVYRSFWERIKQFWTEERWVRVTDEAGKPEFVGLNVQKGMNVQYGPDGMPQLMPMVENATAEMDVDIIIEDTPDFVTLRQEEFEQLADMAGKGIPVPPEMLIQASSLRNKGDLLERMKEDKEQAGQQQMQMQMQQMQAQLESIMAKVNRDNAAAQKDQASTQKIMAEVDETRADTMKTVTETQQMSQPQIVIPNFYRG